MEELERLYKEFIAPLKRAVGLRMKAVGTKIAGLGGFTVGRTVGNGFSVSGLGLDTEAGGEGAARYGYEAGRDIGNGLAGRMLPPKAAELWLTRGAAEKDAPASPVRAAAAADGREDAEKAGDKTARGVKTANSMAAPTIFAVQPSLSRLAREYPFRSAAGFPAVGTAADEAEGLRFASTAYEPPEAPSGYGIPDNTGIEYRVERFGARTAGGRMDYTAADEEPAPEAEKGRGTGGDHDAKRIGEALARELHERLLAGFPMYVR